MVKGWGFERFLRYLALYELEGWGIHPGNPSVGVTGCLLP